ncbi:MAG: hypothetical protein ACJZ72_04415 [Opitutales bacterium]
MCESSPLTLAMDTHGGKTDCRTATVRRLRKTLLSTYTSSQSSRELLLFQAPASKSHFLPRISGLPSV